MEYTLTTSEDRTYIILKMLEDFTATHMMTCVAESHTLGKNLDIHRYLVDVRNARNIDSPVGNYNFAYVDMKEMDFVDPRARVAGLVSAGDHSHDFIETVSLNSGMTMKLFTDPNEAIAFLLRK